MAPVPVNLTLRQGRLNLGLARTMPRSVRERAAAIAESLGMRPADIGSPGDMRQRSLYDQLRDDSPVTEQALLALCLPVSRAAFREKLPQESGGDGASPTVVELLGDARLAGDVTIRLYGRGVALVEADVRLGAPEPDPAGVAALELAGNRLMQCLCTGWVAPAIQQLAEALAGDGVTGALFELRQPLAALQTAAGDDEELLRMRTGWPLWVTRTLFTRGAGAAPAPLLDLWLAEVGAGGDDPQWRDHAAAGSLRWLNYLLPDPAGGTDVSLGRAADGAPLALTQEDAWQTMRLCQFHYAAIELLNHELAVMIGSVADATDPGRLGRRLRRIIRSSQTLLVERRELEKFLNRDKRRLFDTTLERWGLQTALEDAQQRVRICQTQLDEMHRRESERSGFTTELILFAIGAVAILDIMLSLSAYVRTLVSDATQGAHRAEITNPIVGWLMQVSTMQLVSAAMLLVGVVFLVYYRLRRSALRRELGD